MVTSKQSNTGIKWSWLAISMLSLFTGMIYLGTTDLLGPAQMAQNTAPNQETK